MCVSSIMRTALAANSAPTTALENALIGIENCATASLMIKNWNKKAIRKKMNTGRAATNSRCNHLPVAVMLCGKALMLLADTRQGVAQGSTRNLYQPAKWPIQLHDQKDRARNRQRTQKQGYDDRRIVRGEQPEAQKNNSHPENQ